MGRGIIRDRTAASPTAPVKVKLVGIWLRVSTEDQALGDSPEHHEKRARFYAESKGWKIVEVYHLEAVSGKSVMGHPETERMLTDIRTGRVTALIFSKLARLARNTRELLEFADIFREHDADLISLEEAIDTTTPAGRLFYTMIAAMAQWEREEISARTAASVPIRAKLGKSTGGQAPFGYRWENKKLVPDPQEAPVRKLMYELFLEHRRKKTAARLLNDMGHRTRNGGLFTHTTVERLLRDPTAKGLHRANYTRQRGPGKGWDLKPEHEWITFEVEPIVSEDLWRQCNALLDEQRSPRLRPARRTAHLFSGMAHCACGEKMYVPWNVSKYVCRKCRNKIPIEDLEAVFHEQLKGFFFSPTEILAYLEQADRAMKDKEELLRSLEAERKKLRADIEKVWQVYKAGQVSVEGFGEQHRPLEARLRQLEDEVPRLQGEIDFLKIQYLSSDEVLSEARDLQTRWGDLTAEEKRKVVETITERVTVGKGEVTIDLCYLPSSSEIVATGSRIPRGSLPFCHVTLRGQKPLPACYPRELLTLGDHVRKRRLDLGLLQREAAGRVGVDVDTLRNWEQHRNEPALRHMPAVIQFLGYAPYDTSKPLGERLAARRRALGISREALAKALGVDESTVFRWETGRRRPGRHLVGKLKAFLSASPPTLSESPRIRAGAKD